jgi:peroxin-19
MQKQVEELMKNLGIADEPTLDLGGKDSKEKASPKAGDDPFQETIRKTMERMQESGEQASAAVGADEPGDILAEMLKQMQGEGMGAPENEEDFSKMILGMMEQLTNKDILYDPMKELNDKYPGWMASHQTSVKAEDMQRFKEQQGLVSEIVARFEAPGYADTNTADREFIVERMQKVK